jgi:RNA polymerase sigma factor (sigma-70 family)
MSQSQAIPFSRFVTEHSAAVAGFLRGMVAYHDAEECLQETFLAALRAYDSFDGSNPRAWVLTIARNKAIDSERARGRRPDLLAETEQLLASPPPDEGLDAEIWLEVAALPEKQRVALVLRYGLDLRYREIGAVLACSEAAARRSAHEGISKLRDRRTEMAR